VNRPPNGRLACRRGSGRSPAIRAIVGVLSSIPVPHRMTTATPSPLSTAQPTFGELFTPKPVTILREGYGLKDLRADAIAGLTVIHYAADAADALEQIKTSPRTSA
jgi:hypothetical protein